MQSPEVFRLLTRRIRRGFWICRVLWWITAALFVVLLFFPVGRLWAVAALIASIHFYIGSAFAARKMRTAVTISEDPGQVYWVAPTTPPPLLSDTFITFHLRDGAKLEVGLPIDELRRLLPWLKQHEGSLRVGAYDSDGAIPEEWR